ncbi:MAG: hypothetical protein JST54_30185 [Deltaproteobacteria bacterium]|nr:hypothetical protein [Deltaproteobacteria bacterium]
MRTLWLALIVVGASACSGSTSVGADAGPVDAGGTDAGNGTDAGTDAGTPVDAGTPAAHGTLGAWNALGPLPGGRANHCSAAAPGFLVIAGGNHAVSGGGFAEYDDVETAALLEDGGLGPWNVATHLPSGVNECTLAVDGSTLYVVDGIYDDPSYAGKVFAGTIYPDGGASTFIPVGAMPAGHDAIASEAWISNGLLVTEETEVFVDDGGGGLALLTAPVGSFDAASWTVSEFSTTFVGRPQWAFDGSTLFVAGGYDSTLTPLASVSGTTVTGSSASALFATTALPAPTSFGRAVAIDGWLFVVGGKSAVYTGSGTTATFAAPILTGGQLGAWTATSTMPLGRTNHAMAVAGDFLYVTGGATSGPGDANVLAAKIRF